MGLARDLTEFIANTVVPDMIESQTGTSDFSPKSGQLSSNTQWEANDTTLVTRHDEGIGVQSKVNFTATTTTSSQEAKGVASYATRASIAEAVTNAVMRAVTDNVKDNTGSSEQIINTKTQLAEDGISGYDRRETGL